MNGIIGASGVGVGVHTNAPPELELPNVGVVGIEMNTDGDIFTGRTEIPHDLNRRHPIGVRLKYATESADSADTMQWTVLFDIIDEGEAYAIGATALDTAIANDTLTGTVDTMERTARGIINGNTVTASQRLNGSDFVWSIAATSRAAGFGENCILLALMLDYVPRGWQGPDTAPNPAVDDDGIGA